MSDLAADLTATLEGAVLFDLSHLDHAIDNLEDATRDVTSIDAGTCAEALLLADDGSVMRHLDIWVGNEVFAFDHSATAGEGTHHILAVVGPGAGAVVGAVLGDSPGTGQLIEADWRGAGVLAAGNGPVYGSTVTVAAPTSVGHEVRSALQAEGAAAGSTEAYAAIRVQAGELDWGTGAFPDVNPVEADLTHLVDAEARFNGRRAYRRALRRGNERAIVGFTARGGLAPQPGDGLRAGEGIGAVIAVMKHPRATDVVGMGWLEPAPVFHRGSKAFGDPLPQLEVQSDGAWRPVSLTDPPFHKDLM